MYLKCRAQYHSKYVLHLILCHKIKLLSLENEKSQKLNRPILLFSQTNKSVENTKIIKNLRDF